MYQQTFDANVTAQKVGGLSKLVNRFVFQTVGAAWTGAFTLKAAIKDAGLSGSNLKNIHYTNKLTGADVVAGTTITTDGIWEVQCDGMDVYLAYAHTSGSVVVYGNEVAG